MTLVVVDISFLVFNNFRIISALLHSCIISAPSPKDTTTLAWLTCHPRNLYNDPGQGLDHRNLCTHHQKLCGHHWSNFRWQHQRNSINNQTTPTRPQLWCEMYPQSCWAHQTDRNQLGYMGPGHAQPQHRWRCDQGSTKLNGSCTPHFIATKKGVAKLIQDVRRNLHQGPQRPHHLLHQRHRPSTPGPPPYQLWRYGTGRSCCPTNRNEHILCRVWRNSRVHHHAQKSTNQAKLRKSPHEWTTTSHHRLCQCLRLPTLRPSQQGLGTSITSIQNVDTVENRLPPTHRNYACLIQAQGGGNIG